MHGFRAILAVVLFVRKLRAFHSASVTGSTNWVIIRANFGLCCRSWSSEDCWFCGWRLVIVRKLNLFRTFIVAALIVTGEMRIRATCFVIKIATCSFTTDILHQATNLLISKNNNGIFIWGLELILWRVSTSNPWFLDKLLWYHVPGLHNPTWEKLSWGCNGCVLDVAGGDESVLAFSVLGLISVFVGGIDSIVWIWLRLMVPWWCWGCCAAAVVVGRSWLLRLGVDVYGTWYHVLRRGQLNDRFNITTPPQNPHFPLSEPQWFFYPTTSFL